MRTFYIVLPALSLLNMGVNGAIIANTLSSRRDGNTVGSGPYSIRGSRQVRQLHSADFRSDAGTETESSHDTPSGVVSRQTSGDLAVPNAGGDPLEILALRGLQPAMRFARRDFIESTVTSLNDKVAETSKKLFPSTKLAAGTPTNIDTDKAINSVGGALGTRSAFGDEPCNEDTKDVRELNVSTSGSGTDIIANVNPRSPTISHGRVTSAVRRAPSVATSIGSAADAVPEASSAAIAQGTQTLGSLPVRRAVDFATFYNDDVRTISGESRKVAKRQDSNSITDADVATLETAIDNAVATGNAAEAGRSLVVRHESRALPVALPVAAPVDTASLPLPVDPTTMAGALPVKRRFRRQDEASNDAAADSDAAVEVDTTTDSAAETEADTTADAASDDTSDDGASLDELD